MPVRLYVRVHVLRMYLYCLLFSDSFSSPFLFQAKPLTSIGLDALDPFLSLDVDKMDEEAMKLSIIHDPKVCSLVVCVGVRVYVHF